MQKLPTVGKFHDALPERIEGVTLATKCACRERPGLVARDPVLQNRADHPAIIRWRKGIVKPIAVPTAAWVT